MDTLITIIKGLFLSEDGQVNKSAVAKAKDIILWMLVGMALMIGLLLYFGDDDQEEETEAYYNEEVA